MTLEEYTKEIEPKNQNSGCLKTVLITTLIVGSSMFGLGYYVGQKTYKNIVPVPDSYYLPMDSVSMMMDSIERAKEDSAKASIKKKVDSIGELNKEREERIIAKRQQKAYDEAKAMREAAVEQSKNNSQPVKEPAAKQQPVVQQPAKQQSVTPQPKQPAGNVTNGAYRRMQTGAYNIVGTSKTVVVKEGQTLRSISDRNLGPDMECYVQVHNGMMEAPVGTSLKIPALELKKKTAQSASKAE